MKEFILKHKKLSIIVGVILAIVIAIPIIYSILEYIAAPWNYVIHHAYINVSESMFGVTDIALYSSGSGVNEILYLGVQPNEYYIMRNGDVYYYSGPTGRGKVTGIEYGRVFKKIGKVYSVENLKSILINEANVDYTYSSGSFIGSRQYILKVDGKEYTTRTNLFEIVDNHLK